MEYIFLREFFSQSIYACFIFSHLLHTMTVLRREHNLIGMDSRLLHVFIFRVVSILSNDSRARHNVKQRD